MVALLWQTFSVLLCIKLHVKRAEIIAYRAIKEGNYNNLYLHPRFRISLSCKTSNSWQQWLSLGVGIGPHNLHLMVLWWGCCLAHTVKYCAVGAVWHILWCYGEGCLAHTVCGAMEGCLVQVRKTRSKNGNSIRAYSPRSTHRSSIWP